MNNEDQDVFSYDEAERKLYKELDIPIGSFGGIKLWSTGNGMVILMQALDRHFTNLEIGFYRLEWYRGSYKWRASVCAELQEKVFVEFGAYADLPSQALVKAATKLLDRASR